MLQFKITTVSDVCHVTQNTLKIAAGYMLVVDFTKLKLKGMVFLIIDDASDDSHRMEFIISIIICHWEWLVDWINHH